MLSLAIFGPVCALACVLLLFGAFGRFLGEVRTFVIAVLRGTFAALAVIMRHLAKPSPRKAPEKVTHGLWNQ